MKQKRTVVSRTTAAQEPSFIATIAARVQTVVEYSDGSATITTGGLNPAKINVRAGMAQPNDLVVAIGSLSVWSIKAGQDEEGHKWSDAARPAIAHPRFFAVITPETMKAARTASVEVRSILPDKAGAIGAVDVHVAGPGLDPVLKPGSINLSSGEIRVLAEGEVTLAQYENKEGEAFWAASLAYGRTRVSVRPSKNAPPVEAGWKRFLGVFIATKSDFGPRWILSNAVEV